MSKGVSILQDAKKEEMLAKVKANEIDKAQLKEMQSKEGAEPVKVKQGQLTTIVNEGANMQASQMTSQILEKLGTKLNDMITEQTIGLLSKQDVQVNAKDVNALTNPVKVEKDNINKVSSHQANGNLLFLMFTPLWLTTIISSVLLFFAFRSSNLIKVSDRIKAMLFQFMMAIGVGLVGGFGYVFYLKHILDVNIPNEVEISFYIATAIIGFISLILGVMSWLGIRSIPIFMVLLFFSLQVIMLPKEMLPQFYVDYVLPWNPFRYYVEELRSLLYMHQGLEFNGTIAMFIGLLTFGFISTLVASIVRKHSTKRTEVPS
ncbi:hypothetical protein [Staphylococcus massiliensis]|uniref:Phage infection protein n=1 Tax=Staphylococcus massiliensis S46 TaxID=1229783 RepID=K9AUV3_9STAP|nr:hypothetical protein [Staphylococcus massiliensis]EKU46337.1 hypothetical protein C273_09489 [Staphylococcus massiliensis S46]